MRWLRQPVRVNLLARGDAFSARPFEKRGAGNPRFDRHRLQPARLLSDHARARVHGRVGEDGRGHGNDHGHDVLPSQVGQSSFTIAYTITVRGPGARTVEECRADDVQPQADTPNDQDDFWVVYACRLLFGGFWTSTRSPARVATHVRY